MSSCALTIGSLCPMKGLPVMLAMRLSRTRSDVERSVLSSPESNTVVFSTVSEGRGHTRNTPTCYRSWNGSSQSSNGKTQFPQSHKVFSLSGGASGAAMEMKKEKSQALTFLLILGAKSQVLIGAVRVQCWIQVSGNGSH